MKSVLLKSEAIKLGCSLLSDPILADSSPSSENAAAFLQQHPPKSLHTPGIIHLHLIDPEAKTIKLELMQHVFR